MHVSSNPVSRRPARPPLAAAVIVMFASVVGVAQAVEFDEKVKAPQLKDGPQLRERAQAWSEREKQARLAGLDAVIRDRQLAKERFDISWDLQRALETDRPIGDLSGQGLIDRGDGNYDVDLNAYPQWGDPAGDLTGLLSALDPAGLGAELTRRGMQPGDVANLQAFLKTHDVKAVKAAAALPIGVSFSRIVKKYDKVKRPVPDALVMAYIYQRELVAVEAERTLATALLDSVGPDGTRVLQSYLDEMKRSGIFGRGDQRAGIDGVLSDLRLPDYEQRAAAEARGVTP